jgi:two-component system, NarL family, sensor kinase
MNRSQTWKQILLFVIALAIAGPLSAQENVSDSLHLQLITSETDSARGYWNSRLAWYFLNQYQLDSAEQYIARARRIHEKIGDQRSRMVQLHYQGLVHRLKSEFPAALDTFRRVLSYYESVGDTARMTSPLFNLGVVYSLIGDYDRSLEYYYRELAINETHFGPESVANSLNSIANIQRNRGNLEQAKATYHRARQLIEPTDDRHTLASIYGNLATTELLASNLDSTQYWTEKSLVLDRALERDWGIAHSLMVLGQVAQKQGRFEQAEDYLLGALEIRRDLGQPLELITSYQGYAEFLMAREQPERAIPIIQQSVTLSDSIQYTQGLSQGYHLLASAFAKSGRFEDAYRAELIQQSYQDSLLTREKEKALQELDIQYEVRQKEQALERLGFENELQRSLVNRERTGRIALTLSTILFAIMAIGAVAWYRQRMAQESRLSQQEADLQTARIQQLEQREQVNTLHAMIRGQENERKRIASDLHDSLGSLLSTIKLHVRAALSASEQEVARKDVNRMLDHASEEVRRISHHMMPDVLQFGLGPALTDLTQDLNQAADVAVRCQIIGQEPEDFGEDSKIMLYRIAQEGVQNALKHADPNQVLMQLSWLADQAQITIEDDGRGFDVKDVNSGLGLRSMQSRTDLLNGQLLIDSTPGDGTVIEVQIPLDLK